MSAIDFSSFIYGSLIGRLLGKGDLAEWRKHWNFCLDSKQTFITQLNFIIALTELEIKRKQQKDRDTLIEQSPLDCVIPPIHTKTVHEFLTYCIPVYEIFSCQLMLTIVTLVHSTFYNKLITLQLESD